MGGIVAAPAIVGLGLVAQKKAGDAEKQADAKIREIGVAEAQIDRERAKLTTIRQRTSEVRRTITGLTSELKSALIDADPDKPEEVYRVVQLAKTLRVALDEPVIPR